MVHNEGNPMQFVPENQEQWARNQSRIDIIGQNGNDGLHYNADKAGLPEKEYVKRLVQDHWAYIEGVLEPYLAPDDLNVIKFHYKSAMEHGWRHAKEYYTGSV